MQLLTLFFSFFIFSGVLACSLTVLSVHGLYSSSDDVVELNPSNFNREVMQSDSLWLVEFYAPCWLWTEAGAQMELEASLGIGGFGYPAMAAINARKMKFALLKGSFGESGIHEFLR
ncbi:Protein disulfide-isomerase A6 [Anabarilius grahami]|uniref:Protein disulfide-isomerase A6 n=1 Tax=Anabarilius grahami TaxID=495550 RepID=A0A3N0XID0_ANAGA|nr:Protein disulfide-isomerase A6 [Anabarilius grahami]